MAVKIGNASISENGSITGKAGDQNGREVRTGYWRNNSKGWVTLRCKNVAMREYIAEAMEKACANSDIGYDQTENKTLWNNIKDKGFDPSKTTKKVETDCARLVRVCVQYAVIKAGLNITVPDCYTANLATKLMSTGLFEKYTDADHCKKDDFLIRGDIQVTKTKGHTWVILSNGEKSGGTNVAPKPEKVVKFGDRTLSKGCKGADVKELQNILAKAGYPLGSIDGDFGAKTESAVKNFQFKNNLEADGVVGTKTYAALKKINTTTKKVLVTGGTVHVRKTDSIFGKHMFYAKKNEKYDFIATKGNWHNIKTASGEGWISSKYSKLVEG